MKIYLDDERKPPFGWELVKTADECIEMLKTGKVEMLSLDHDLAQEHYEPAALKRLDDDPSRYEEHLAGYREKTGYSVVLWMIENNVWPKLVILHTLNPVGRDAMKQALHRHAPISTVLQVRPGWRRES